MNDLQKKLISIVLTIVICLSAFYAVPAKRAGASTTYITVEAFAESLAKELGLSSIEGSTGYGYLDALIEKGIILKDDFTSYKGYLTRGDTMVLINRADEYLYGDTLLPELVQLAINKRISDITSVKESKREDVAKAYLKGFVKGYSNGDYSTDRSMKVKSKITKAGALGCIKMLKNKKLRAKISPDGQLIRTTNLPKNADMFPYILASYPNDYYNWYLHYEDCNSRTTYNPATGKMEEYKFVYLKDYAAPVDVDKTTQIENFSELKKMQLDTWVNKVKTYMECIFNVDYRTIGSDWINKVVSTDYTYGYWGMEDQTRKELETYIRKIKRNNTVVECSKVAVDGSSLYYVDGRYYLRVYVKYRIVSTNVIYNGGKFYENGDLLYSNSAIWLYNTKLGIWNDSYFDVALVYYNNDEKENLGVLWANLYEFCTDYKY